ncbi:MAG: FtsX-like permease family protein [Treponema sp.]|nr:FtsX-like permease family protein [Treponema sp.]
MFTLNFAFKNIISRKSSLVIILFIAFSIAVLVMANAVFDGTKSGIEKTFSQNFTGDIVVRPKAQFPMSLFGDETPITGNLSELPQLIPYTDIYSYVSDLEFVKKALPQITGQAVLRFDDSNFASYFFGVDAQDYVSLMPGIKILQGEPYSADENGIMISNVTLQKIYEEHGVMLQVGDQIQLAGFTGSSYTLRAATLSAVYEYAVHNDLQDKIILINPDILRPLIGLNSTEIDTSLFTQDNSGLLENLDQGGIDDLFGDCEDFDSDDFFAEESLPAQEAAAQTVEEAEQVGEETIWNYIVCSTAPGVSVSSAIRKMNREFAKREWPCQAVDWRAAAGMAAQYIYWMRLIFNIGLIIIIGTGFIIVNNTLVIAALDRSKETGALRAIGAGRRFVALEYLAETLMLTITAGILGCVLGAIGNTFLSNGSIHFSNTYLVQLFGGDTLRAVVRLPNILSGMALSLILAFVAWLYPVKIALNTSPVAAMEAVR